MFQFMVLENFILYHKKQSSFTNNHCITKEDFYEKNIQWYQRRSFMPHNVI